MNQLDKITDVFVNWQALLLAVVSFIIVGLLRGLGTKKDKDGKVIGGFAQSNAFQMFTPLYPYLITIGAVFIPGVPLPDGVVKTVAVKIFFGLWAGWLSGYSFQVIKKVLEKGFGMNFDPQLPDAPAPPAPATKDADATPKEVKP
jgi:hypothetical protein